MFLLCKRRASKQNKNNPLPRIKFFERGVGKSFLLRKFSPHKKYNLLLFIMTMVGGEKAVKVDFKRAAVGFFESDCLE